MLVLGRGTKQNVMKNVAFAFAFAMLHDGIELNVKDNSQINSN